MHTVFLLSSIIIQAILSCQVWAKCYEDGNKFESKSLLSRLRDSTGNHGDEWALCPVSNGRDAEYFDCSEVGEEHFIEPWSGPDLGSDTAMKALAPLQKTSPIWWPDSIFSKMRVVLQDT